MKSNVKPYDAFARFQTGNEKQPTTFTYNERKAPEVYWIAYFYRVIVKVARLDTNLNHFV